MEPHSLTSFTAKLIEEHGAPRVLDVEHSVRVHKPTLTGSSSPASYYILPPPGMSADALIEWFDSVPGFRESRLTLVSIMGLDTYHQPLITSDDYAKKHFHDNTARMLRVTGKSDQAIETMAVFIEALKSPFDPAQFPYHSDFSVSGYKPHEEGRSSVVKLLFKPADHSQLVRIERLVSVHLDESYLGREILTSRHAMRDMPPELTLATAHDATPDGITYLKELAESLPAATPEEIAEATEAARRGSEQATVTAASHTRFASTQVAARTLSPHELQTKALASLAEIMKVSKFANGAEIKLEQRGTKIEVKFPKSILSLLSAGGFQEKKHVPELASYCVGVRTDPILRNGWSAIYNFESGVLSIRAIETGSDVLSGWKLISG